MLIIVTQPRRLEGGRGPAGPGAALPNGCAAGCGNHSNSTKRKQRINHNTANTSDNTNHVNNHHNINNSNINNNYKQAVAPGPGFPRGRRGVWKAPAIYIYI